MRKPNIEGIKTMDPEAVFTPLEVAELLGYTQAGALRLIRVGTIEHYTLGKRYYVKGSAIQKFMNFVSNDVV